MKSKCSVLIAFRMIIVLLADSMLIFLSKMCSGAQIFLVFSLFFLYSEFCALCCAVDCNFCKVWDMGAFDNRGPILEAVMGARNRLGTH